MITPSFNLTATERVLPRLALDFTTASLDARITFARSGNTATAVNSSGFVGAVNADVPRFDYDPVSLACRGLLIEEARTNICLQSNGFDQFLVWNNLRATANATSGTSPDGTNNAFKLVEDTTAANSHSVQQTIATTAVAHTLSCYAKAGERTWIALRLRDSAGTNRLAYFNLGAGTVGTVQTNLTATISNAGNGWYRCVATVSAAFAGNSIPGIFLATGDNETVYDGDGTSGLYIWGAQLEAGAFATSYIPTTTTALTRNADVATMTGTNFSDWFNASEGAFVSTATLYSPPINNDVVWQLYTTSSSVDNVITCFQNYGTTSRVRMLGYNGTTNDVSVYPTQTYAANQQIKIAAAYKQNNYALSANGNTTLTDTSGGVPPVVGLRIGSGEGIASYIINGWVAELNYYSQRLTDAELQAFSK